MPKTQEKENKIFMICDYCPIGILFFNKENRLSLMNSQAEKFLDVKAKKTVGKSISQLSRVSRFKLLLGLFPGRKIKEIFHQEVQVKKNLILKVSSFPVSQKGKKIGTVIILEDTTREKEIERMKIQFISLAAHQFRTPLSAIKWGLRIILDGEMGRLTKKQKEFLEKIYHSNERMIFLIKDLSLVTKIEKGKYILRPTYFQIEDIVESVISSYKKEIKRENISFKFKKPKRKLPKVFGDIKQLSLAIQNLLENSLSYIYPGGKVTISLKGRKKELEFKIKDDGFGIPVNQQRKVFKKFFRGANVIRKGTEGSGLSLFVTRNIIKAHRGEIWFKSQKNKGTTFYFTLPVARSLKGQKDYFKLK